MSDVMDQPQTAAQQAPPMDATTAQNASNSADSIQAAQDALSGNAPLNARPQVQNPADQAAPPAQKPSLMSDILHAVGEVLGGPSTVKKVNPQTGVIEEVPLSRSQRIANTAGIYIRGAAAGAAQHGPGAVGKAGLAGVKEEEETEQRQTDNTLEQSKNVQSQLAGQASRAMQAQQIAESGWRMQREQTDVDQNTSDKFNAMQSLVSSDPTNKDLGHYASFSDLTSAHPELQKAGINIPQLLYQGRIRTVVTTQNGKSTGIQAYQVNPEWDKQKTQDPITVKTPDGLDAKGNVQYKTTVVPAGAVTNERMLTLLGQQGKEGLDASEKAAQIQNAATNTKNAGVKDIAEAANAYSEQKLHLAQAKNLENGAAKNDDGSWNPASIPVALVEHNMDPTQLSKRTTDYNAKIQAASQYSLEKYGKPFDLAQAQSDYKYATTSQNQNTLKMINAMIEPNGSIQIAANAAKSLPQMDSKTLNKVFNATATEFGSPEATNFHTSMLGLADEYSKVMGGGVSSDTGRQQALDLLKNSYSNKQLDGAIGIMQRDISARKTAIVGNNPYLIKQYGAPAPPAPQGATAEVLAQDGKTVIGHIVNGSYVPANNGPATTR